MRHDRLVRRGGFVVVGDMCRPVNGLLCDGLDGVLLSVCGLGVGDDVARYLFEPMVLQGTLKLCSHWRSIHEQLIARILCFFALFILALGMYCLLLLVAFGLHLHLGIFACCLSYPLPRFAFSFPVITLVLSLLPLLSPRRLSVYRRRPSLAALAETLDA